MHRYKDSLIRCGYRKCAIYMIVAALRGRFTVAWTVGLPEYRGNKQSVSVLARSCVCVPATTKFSPLRLRPRPPPSSLVLQPPALTNPRRDRRFNDLATNLPTRTFPPHAQQRHAPSAVGAGCPHTHTKKKGGVIYIYMHAWPLLYGAAQRQTWRSGGRTGDPARTSPAPAVSPLATTHAHAHAPHRDRLAWPGPRFLCARLSRSFRCGFLALLGSKATYWGHAGGMKAAHCATGSRAEQSRARALFRVRAAPPRHRPLLRPTSSRTS